MRSHLRPNAVLLHRGEAPLQVVEDETRRRPLAHGGDDDPPVCAGHGEHLTVVESRVDLGQPGAVTPKRRGALEQLPRGARKRVRSVLGNTHGTRDRAVSRNDGRRLDLRRDLDEIRERSPRIHDTDAIKVQTSRP